MGPVAINMDSTALSNQVEIQITSSLTENSIEPHRALHSLHFCPLNTRARPSFLSQATGTSGLTCPGKETCVSPHEPCTGLLAQRPVLRPPPRALGDQWL